MRRRVTLLMAATTSAVILAFLLPLGLLVRTLAEDRATAAATQEAQNVAILVATARDSSQLQDVVDLVDERSSRSTSVLLPDGTALGAPQPEQAGPADTRALRLARRGTASTVVGDGARVYLPVITPGGTAVIRTAVADSELHAGVTSALVTLALLGAGLLALSLVVADRLGRAVGRPIGDVARAAHSLREGRLDTRAPVQGPREVRELAAALNLLAERIGELLAAEREAVADLSHRLRTPLTALRLHAENERVPTPDRRDDGRDDAFGHPQQRLHDHVTALERTVDSILRDARRPVTAPVSRGCDAAAVVRARAAFWLPLAEDQRRAVSVDLPEGPVPVGLDAEDLADAVDALIDNVFAHTPERTALHLCVRRPGPGPVEVVVEDAGPGVPAGAGERGASQVGSSGLGLDIARRTAESSGGHLAVGVSPLGGAAVRLVLGRPAAGTEAPAGRGARRP